MDYNRSYSKKFGFFLVLLALAIGCGFVEDIGSVEMWGVDSTAHSPFAVLWAFSFVFTGAIGLAFYRGVFLMSDAVIKPRQVEATAEASEAV